MKKLTAMIVLLVSAATLTAAPKAKKPKNFSDLFGKNWTLEKAIYKGKDMTAGYNSQMTGGALVYTFAEDGKMTTTEPNMVSVDWKFDDKGLNIHQEQPPTPETPAGEKGPQATVFYQIKKLSKDTLVLDQPGMKMTLTFKAK